MASPVGHSLVGFALGLAIQPNQGRTSWAWLIFVTFAANAPDFDFLPGFAIGDPNRFHQGGSHSFVSAVLFGLICGLVAWMIRRPILLMGTTGGVLYLSHLVVDLLTRDRRPPMGLPLLWPVSQEYFVLPVTIFPGVSHGNGPTGIQGFLEDLLAWSNVYALGLEFVVLLPFAGGVVWWRRQSMDANE